MAITHKWNGTILEITSDSGTSAADLKGAKGDTGARGVRGLQGERGGGALIEDGVISSETTWSSSRIMDNFAEAMSVSGNPVSCTPIPNYPLHIITTINQREDSVSAINLVRCGKNLFDYKKPIYAQASTMYEVNGESLRIYTESEATWQGLKFVNFIAAAGTTYVGSLNVESLVAGKLYFGIRNIETNQFEATATETSSGVYTFTYTPLKDTKVFLSIVITNSTTLSGDVTVNNVQLEINDTVSDYEPYNGNTYTMYLPEPIYGGSIDWNTGVITAEYDANGALEEPYTMEAEPVLINAIEDTNTLYTDADRLTVIGRVDTMRQLSELAARIAALENALVNA